MYCGCFHYKGEGHMFQCADLADLTRRFLQIKKELDGNKEPKEDDLTEEECYYNSLIAINEGILEWDYVPWEKMNVFEQLIFGSDLGEKYG